MILSSKMRHRFAPFYKILQNVTKFLLFFTFFEFEINVFYAKLIS